jgi:hypothetical protein
VKQDAFVQFNLLVNAVDRLSAEEKITLLGRVLERYAPALAETFGGAVRAEVPPTGKADA